MTRLVNIEALTPAERTRVILALAGAFKRLKEVADRYAEKNPGLRRDLEELSERFGHQLAVAERHYVRDLTRRNEEIMLTRTAERMERGVWGPLRATPATPTNTESDLGRDMVGEAGDGGKDE